jgi:hypothetical protein
VPVHLLSRLMMVGEFRLVPRLYAARGSCISVKFVSCNAPEFRFVLKLEPFRHSPQPIKRPTYAVGAQGCALWIPCIANEIAHSRIVT